MYAVYAVATCKEAGSVATGGVKAEHHEAGVQQGVSTASSMGRVLQV